MNPSNCKVKITANYFVFESIELVVDFFESLFPYSLNYVSID